MNPIQVVIVDDEHLARENLQILLKDVSDMEVVGTCSNGFEAIETIRRLRPDIVFLDIKMPEISGFDVLSRLDRTEWPLVIFVTAFDEYAVSAFELNALDYLLKPFNDDRFSDTLQRIRGTIRLSQIEEYSGRMESLLAERSIAADSKHSSYATRLAIKSAGRTFFVDVADLDWIEASGNYLELYLSDKMHLLRMPMKELIKRLDPAHFARIHRSTIVNLNAIHQLKKYARGDYEVMLKNGKLLRLSRRYRRDFHDLFSI